jgi:hypothetical protein
MLRLFTVPLLASLVVGALLTGCSKPGNNAPEGAGTAAAESGPLVAEFPSIDPSSWVNGAPMSFAQARGSVVLVEAWGRY